MKFKIKEIRTEDDYYFALSRRDQIIDAYPGTKLAEELSHLSTIIQQYEEKQLNYGKRLQKTKSNKKNTNKAINNGSSKQYKRKSGFER